MEETICQQLFLNMAHRAKGKKNGHLKRDEKQFKCPIFLQFSIPFALFFFFHLITKQSLGFICSSSSRTQVHRTVLHTCIKIYILISIFIYLHDHIFIFVGRTELIGLGGLEAFMYIAKENFPRFDGYCKVVNRATERIEKMVAQAKTPGFFLTTKSVYRNQLLHIWLGRLAGQHICTKP